jgi:hypothetical protein
MDYSVSLTNQQRTMLDKIVKKGNLPGFTILKALALLLCDKHPEGRAKQTPGEVSRELNLAPAAVHVLLKRFHVGGATYAIGLRKLNIPRDPASFDDAFKAKLVALACSPPPPGAKRWSYRRLADMLEELGLTPPHGISTTTVSRFLAEAKVDLLSGTIGGPRRRKKKPVRTGNYIRT